MFFASQSNLIQFVDSVSRRYARAETAKTLNNELGDILEESLPSVNAMLIWKMDYQQQKVEIIGSLNFSERELNVVSASKSYVTFQQIFKQKVLGPKLSFGEHQKISFLKFIKRVKLEEYVLPLHQGEVLTGGISFFVEDSEWNADQDHFLNFLGNATLSNFDRIFSFDGDIESLSDYVQSKTFYKAAIEYGSDLVFVVDKEGKVLYHNPSTEDLLGYVEGSLIGKSLKDLLDQTQLDDFDKMLDRTVQEDNFEFLLKNSMGSFQYFEMNAIDLSEKDGVEGWILDCRDIRDRKSSESSLNNNQRMLNETLNALPLDIYLKDQKGKFLFINGSAAKSLKIDQKLAIGKTDMEVFPKEKALRNKEIEDQLILNDKPIIEAEVDEIKNERNYFLTGREQLQIDNYEKLILGYSYDITDTVKAQIELDEQRKFIKQVLDTDPNIITVKDFKGNYVLVNKEADRFLENISEEQSHKTTIFHSNIAEISSLSQLDKDILYKGIEKTFEEAFTLKNGEQRWFQTTKKRLSRNDGASQILSISVDITQRKKDSEKIIEAQKTKEQFLANMSHEIRTPINGIAGMLNLILETDTTTEQKKYLKSIKTSTENLAVIINDILDLAKMESGKMTFEKIGFKFENQITSVIDGFEARANEKGIALKYDIDGLTSKIYLGDPVRLNQILINLIGNAVKFTSKGEIRISTHHIENLGDRDLVEFRVKDSGVGIHETKLNAIFDSFSQEDESVTRKFGGTGLGLSITKQLVELQDGTIGVESVLHEGSTFIFRIPYPIGKDEDLVETDDENKPRISELGSLKGVNVLLVEDNELNQMYASNVLKKWNCDVDIAENGLIALEKLKKNPYDIVLMDCQMPVMDGYEASTSIRDNFQAPISTIPIIALTANAISGEKEKCLAAGMSDYISKPFTPEELFTLISKYLKPSDIATRKEEKIKEEEEMQSKEVKGTITDLSYLSEMCDGDKEFMGEMVDSFLEKIPETLDLMKVSLEQKDWVQIGLSAHKIKPTIAFMGIESLKETVMKLEDIGKHEKEVELIPDLLNKLIETIEDALKELAAMKEADMVG